MLSIMPAVGNILCYSWRLHPHRTHIKSPPTVLQFVLPSASVYLCLYISSLLTLNIFMLTNRQIKSVSVFYICQLDDQVFMLYWQQISCCSDRMCLPPSYSTVCNVIFFAREEAAETWIDLHYPCSTDFRDEWIGTSFPPYVSTACFWTHLNTYL